MRSYTLHQAIVDAWNEGWSGRVELLLLCIMIAAASCSAWLGWHVLRHLLNF